MRTKPIAIVLVSVLAGAGVATALQRSAQVEEPTVNDDASTQARLATLEFALDEERKARQLLEDELFRLIAMVDAEPRATGRPREESAPQRAAREESANATVVSSGEWRPPNRKDQLTAGGFSEDRAAYIATREAELRMEAMQARFEATQSGDNRGFGRSALLADRTLREELGELEYEQYLEASNRPTAVAISTVMDLSPAEQAGLQQGDQIVRYAGERVYNVVELNQLQLQAAAGSNVTVDILRNGTPMQITLPSGPLGIQAARGRRR